MSYFGGVPASVGLPRSKAGALRAVELEAGSPSPIRVWVTPSRSGTGTGRVRNGNTCGPLELDPDNPEALCRYRLFLWGKLGNAEALVQLRRALEIDPFSLDTNWILGWACISAGQLDVAAELASKMIAMDPNLWTGYIRGSVYALKDLWAEAFGLRPSGEDGRGPTDSGTTRADNHRALHPARLAGRRLRQRGSRGAGTPLPGAGVRRT